MRPIWHMGLVLCVSIALVSSHAQSDPLQQLITYDQPAQTVKQLLADLSKQTGVRLFAPNPIDAEIVLVSVKQMPLKELMEHLAYVTDGEWFRQKDGSYHLVRSPKLARERREQDNEQILKGLQRALNRKEVQQLIQPLTEQQAREYRDKIISTVRELQMLDKNIVSYESPQTRELIQVQHAIDVFRRLAARLAQKIDLRRLLEIPVGERRVFSNVRGRFLLPFNFAVEPLLKQHFQEWQIVYNLWTHPTEGVTSKLDMTSRQSADYFLFDDWLRQPPPSQPPNCVYLIVERSSINWFIFDVILAADQESATAYRILLAWDLWAEQEEEDKAKSSLSETSSLSPRRVEWSERSRQFLDAYRAMQRTTESVPLPEILDPAKVEPLSLIPTDVLRTFAQMKGKPIVALIDDYNSDLWFSIAVGGRYEFEADDDMEFKLLPAFEITETANLLLVKPRFSSYKWIPRISRQSLSEWLRHILQKKYLDLEDYLSLMRIVKHQSSGEGIEKTYLSLFLEPLFLWRIYPSTTQFLSSLTDEQIAQLLAGQELPLSAFTPSQREQLIGDIYFRTTSIRKQAAKNRSEDVVDVPIQHLFPNGLPNETRVRLQPSEPELGVLTRCRAGVWSDFKKLASLAFDIVQVQNSANESTDAYWMRRLSERVARYHSQPLMPVRWQRFVLEVRLGEDYYVQIPWINFDLGKYELLNGGKPATLDSLPQEIRDTIQQQIERLQKRKSDGN